MRKFLRRLLAKPVARIAERYSSRPDKERIHAALNELYIKTSSGSYKKGKLIEFHPQKDSFIIFSDQHKGTKNGSDDFACAEGNYLAALDYYNQRNFHFISLGDSEELWENLLVNVKKYNVDSFEKEKLFLQRHAFTKVFGNHDLDWDNSPLAPFELQSIYGQKVPIYEGVILRTANAGLDIFLTHGHQGDKVSDGNWFSKWFVANVWAPFQAFLSLNPNTPAYDDQLKSDHNRFMYEWIAQQKNKLLITGHTHQPIFQSLTHLEKLYYQLSKAKADKKEAEIQSLEAQIQKVRRHGEILPDFTSYNSSYFNTGCCCFNDGDITGIEITDGCIRLIKWEYGTDKKSTPGRIVLDEAPLLSIH